MNVNEKFLSFPPFLSTAWIHVEALSISRQGTIAVHMNSGATISLPEMSEPEMELVFKAHATFLENQILSEPVFKNKKLPPTIKERLENDSPFRISFGSPEGLNGVAMQHNPAQKNAPNLPLEMLAKITEVSKIMAPNDPDQIPKAEPHCNCYHCQIARALSGSIEETPEEEFVAPEELEFNQWEITETGDNLFNVMNKLDTLENYSVHLGHPVGCTCGKENCEHILAVLKS